MFLEGCGTFQKQEVTAVIKAATADVPEEVRTEKQQSEQVIMKDT